MSYNILRVLVCPFYFYSGSTWLPLEFSGGLYQHGEH